MTLSCGVEVTSIYNSLILKHINYNLKIGAARGEYQQAKHISLTNILCIYD